MAEPFPPLDPVEVRVLGVLVEKQHTVPDTYPLSRNALAAGCNQKSSREPVMEIAEPDIEAALERLRARTLVVESSGGRVARYAQNVARVLQVPGAAVSLLAVLMLRGPQTPAEIRTNAERLHRFADVSVVEAYLDELAARDPPLVSPLPRTPGTREVRWAHLLSGPPVVPDPLPAAATRAAGASGRDDLAGRLEALEGRVRALEEALASVQAAAAMPGRPD